ncbi:MAG: hypothetical protein ACYTG7_22980, partial [Planctomycetota bacterium]
DLASPFEYFFHEQRDEILDGHLVEVLPDSIRRIFDRILCLKRQRLYGSEDYYQEQQNIAWDAHGNLSIAYSI